jgi:hypothetical protein
MKHFKQPFIIILILIPLSIVHSDENRTSLSIARARYFIESKGDYNTALSLLDDINREHLDEYVLSQLLYYRLVCQIQLQQYHSAQETRRELEAYDSKWSNLADELPATSNKEDSNDNSMTSNSRNDSSMIALVIKSGGTLQELVALQQHGVTTDMYLELLENGSDINTLKQYLTKENLTVFDAVNILVYNIEFEDYKLLTDTNRNQHLTSLQVWSYAQDPRDIGYLADLFRLGFDENKLEALKEKNIDIQYFIDSLSRGISEENFFKLKDRKLSDSDLDYYEFFLRQGHSRFDFQIARVFGKDGYDQFLIYLRNRRAFRLNLSLSLSFSIISIALFSVGIAFFNYETLYSSQVNLLWAEYNFSTDSDKRLNILTNLIPSYELKIEQSKQIKTATLIVAGISTLGLIAPTILLGFFSGNNSRLLKFTRNFRLEAGPAMVAWSWRIRL